jgi:hypothetical protein
MVGLVLAVSSASVAAGRPGKPPKTTTTTSTSTSTSTTTTTTRPPSVTRGFDTCAAPSTTTMSAWKASSPYTSIGVYIGGANAACVNVTSSWVSTVTAQGWRLAPLYVGLQASCSGFTSKMNSDPTWASIEGLVAADDAASEAVALGLGASAPIYFDLEAYNSADSTCANAAIAFVHSWAYELHTKGFTAGLYSSSASGIKDEASTYTDPNDHQLDGIWFANWDNRISVFGDPFFSDLVWPDHQRLHQYAGGHNETWGGARVNIDSNATDGLLYP